MLQNAYLLAKIGADTAENERNFAEILPKNGNYPTGPPSSPRDYEKPEPTVIHEALLAAMPGDRPT